MSEPTPKPQTYLQLHHIENDALSTTTPVTGIDYNRPSLIYIGGRGEVDLNHLPKEEAESVRILFHQPELSGNGHQLYCVTMGDNPPGLDELNKDEKQFIAAPHSHTHESARQFVKQVFTPLLEDMKESRDVNASLEKTMRGMSGITLFGFCHGSLMIGEITNALADEMNSLGYEKQQIASCMNSVAALHTGTNAPIVERKCDIPSLHAYVSHDNKSFNKHLTEEDTHPSLAVGKTGRHLVLCGQSETGANNVIRAAKLIPAKGYEPKRDSEGNEVLMSRLIPDENGRVNKHQWEINTRRKYAFHTPRIINTTTLIAPGMMTFQYTPFGHICTGYLKNCLESSHNALEGGKPRDTSAILGSLEKSHLSESGRAQSVDRMKVADEHFTRLVELQQAARKAPPSPSY